MSMNIGKEEVRELVGKGAALVEVLAAQAYEKAHLAGAVSIPLTGLSQNSTARLQPDQPIIVYCYDYQ